MPRRKVSKGICAYCGEAFAKNGAGKHLAVCTKRQAVMAKAEGSKGPSEDLYYLRAQAEDQPQFWLDLEMRGTATLKDLDYYLRGIWLECCGHLSQFSIGGWGGDKIAFSRPISAVFKPDVELTHIYDFGTESVTLITALGKRHGVPTTKKPIALLLRNQMPEVACIECGQPATWLCIECQIEHNSPGALCDIHIKKHPHHNYGEPTKIVNSPRVGLCGYVGPAMPPY